MMFSDPNIESMYQGAKELLQQARQAYAFSHQGWVQQGQPLLIVLFGLYGGHLCHLSVVLDREPPSYAKHFFSGIKPTTRGY